MWRRVVWKWTISPISWLVHWGSWSLFFDGHLQDQAHGKNVLLFCFLGGCYCYMGAKSIKLRYHFWVVLCQSWDSLCHWTVLQSMRCLQRWLHADLWIHLSVGFRELGLQHQGSSRFGNKCPKNGWFWKTTRKKWKMWIWFDLIVKTNGLSVDWFKGESEAETLSFF